MRGQSHTGVPDSETSVHSQFQLLANAKCGDEATGDGSSRGFLSPYVVELEFPASGSELAQNQLLRHLEGKPVRGDMHVYVSSSCHLLHKIDNLYRVYDNLMGEKNF